ncbi:hypothetical protein [Butyrivibrio sp. MC2021]|uniref:hypothetical protein n=1 Tax=Butyrivibrio sp. MC2021 TaxID=1408306 RepID=UPI00047E891A|nr:hypothetical protein [Butyrivibrio sp. MC2021]
MNKKNIAIIGLLATIALSGCGEKAPVNSDLTAESSSIEATTESASQTASSDATESTSASTEASVEAKTEPDYDIPLMNDLGETAYLEKVGAKKYDYTEAFELTDDLRGTIETLFLVVGRYDSESLVKKADWKDIFVDRFLKNSWYSCSYLSNIYDGDSLMDKDQIEYFQYSITGKYVEFPEYANSPLDTAEASSGFNTANIIDYEVAESGDEIHLSANVGMCEGIKEDYDYTYKMDVVLVKNPYSCFNGYNIVSLDYEENTSYQAPDGK